MSIQHIKTAERLSYVEAKRKFYGNNQSNSKNYANIAATIPAPNENYVATLAAALAPQVARLLLQEQKARPETTAIQTSKHQQQKFELKNRVPTAVLRKAAAPSKPTPKVQTTRPQSISSAHDAASRKEIQDKVDEFLKDMIPVISPSTSGNEGRTSVRERSSSGSSSARQPRKKITSPQAYSDQESDMDTDGPIFESRPGPSAKRK